MKWILIALALLLVIALVVFVVGALLPRDHVATVTARIPAPPRAVWDVLVDPSEFPKWRPGVERVELLAPGAAGPSWREFAKHGAITMTVDAAEVPHRLVTRIADANLPFGGTWEFGIADDGPSASRVTVTERGSVHNPVFRFVSRFVLGHTASLTTFLQALGARFGADVVPTVVER